MGVGGTDLPAVLIFKYFCLEKLKTNVTFYCDSDQFVNLVSLYSSVTARVVNSACDDVEFFISHWTRDPEFVHDLEKSLI